MTDDGFDSAAQDEFFAARGTEPDVQLKRGQYWLPGANSGEYYGHTRATTFSKAIEDFYHINQWKCRQVAFVLGQRSDLVSLAASAESGDDKDVLSEVVKQAEAVGQTEGANEGTAFHGALYRAVQADWNLDGIPEQFHPSINSVRAELDRCGIELLPEFAERVVLNEDYDVAGRFDYLGRYDGGLIIVDLKSQKTMDFGALAIAVQLSLYANADLVWDGARKCYEAMPPGVRTDLAVVIHCRPGGEASAHRINLLAGYTAARVCAEARDMRKLKHLVTPMPPGAAEAMKPSLSVVKSGDARPADFAETVDETGAAVKRNDPFASGDAGPPDSDAGDAATQIEGQAMGPQWKPGQPDAELWAAYAKRPKDELVAECVARKLDTKGSKLTLAQRIAEYDTAGAVSAHPAEDNSEEAEQENEQPGDRIDNPFATPVAKPAPQEPTLYDKISACTSKRELADLYDATRVAWTENHLQAAQDHLASL